jgi:hypothetical protein
MNRLSCFFERVSDLSVGMFLLLFGLGLAIISFTVIPVIGLVVAIPVLILAVAFLFARRSKACALLSERTRKLMSS